MGPENETPQNPQGAPVINVNNPAQPQGRFFSEDDINKARTQERDKYHKQMQQLQSQTESMNTELAKLKEDREKREAEEKARQQEIADAKKAKEEAELSAKELAEKIRAESEQRLQEMNEKLELQQAVFAKERQFQEMRQYVQSKIEANKTKIMPELYDTINGETVEEIDASVENAISRTNAILESVKRMQSGQSAGQQGVSSAGFTPTGPIDTNAGLPQDMTPEQQAQAIQSMGMKEFQEKVRGPLGLDSANDYSMSKLWGNA